MTVSRTPSHGDEQSAQFNMLSPSRCWSSRRDFNDDEIERPAFIRMTRWLSSLSDWDRHELQVVEIRNESLRKLVGRDEQSDTSDNM